LRVHLNHVLQRLPRRGCVLSLPGDQGLREEGRRGGREGGREGEGPS
jgi:hypothetical protein